MERGRNLSREIEAARQRLVELTAEYAGLPPEVLAELAWRGVAWYYGADGATARILDGEGSKIDLKMASIKDQRLAALADDESREAAIKKATAWLDDHFDD